MNNKNPEVIIDCKQLAKTYDDGASKVDVLHHLDLQVYRGEKLAIIGQSGSGKSTLLHLIGALDQPSSGQVTIHNIDIHQLSAKKGGVQESSFGLRVSVSSLVT